MAIATEKQMAKAMPVDSASDAKYGPNMTGVRRMKTREKERRPNGVRYCLRKRSCIRA